MTTAPCLKRPAEDRAERYVPKRIRAADQEQENLESLPSGYLYSQEVHDDSQKDNTVCSPANIIWTITTDYVAQHIDVEMMNSGESPTTTIPGNDERLVCFGTVMSSAPLVKLP